MRRSCPLSSTVVRSIGLDLGDIFRYLRYDRDYTYQVIEILSVGQMHFVKLYSLAFFLAILGTTTIISEMRDLKKRRMQTEHTDQEKNCLLKGMNKEDLDEGFVDHGYEEGYFSLYNCDQTSYEEHH